MFNTCEGIENELSKHPVLPSQPLYRQYYMSNGNYLRKKKDNIWIYTLKIHVATLHKPPITRVLFWQWSLKIDQVQNKFRTLKEKCTSYLVGSERSYLCWQKKKKSKNIHSSFGSAHNKYYLFLLQAETYLLIPNYLSAPAHYQLSQLSIQAQRQFGA